MKVLNGLQMVTIPSGEPSVSHVEEWSDNPSQDVHSMKPGEVEVEWELDDMTKVNGNPLQTPSRRTLSVARPEHRLRIESAPVEANSQNVSRLDLVSGEGMGLSVALKSNGVLLRTPVRSGVCQRVLDWSVGCLRACFGQRASGG